MQRNRLNVMFQLRRTALGAADADADADADVDMVVVVAPLDCAALALPPLLRLAERERSHTVRLLAYRASSVGIDALLGQRVDASRIASSTGSVGGVDWVRRRRRRVGRVS